MAQTLETQPYPYTLVNPKTKQVRLHSSLEHKKAQLSQQDLKLYGELMDVQKRLAQATTAFATHQHLQRLIPLARQYKFTSLALDIQDQDVQNRIKAAIRGCLAGYEVNIDFIQPLNKKQCDRNRSHINKLRACRR